MNYEFKDSTESIINYERHCERSEAIH